MSVPSQANRESESLSQNEWRERFLQRILIISAIVGLLALIPAVISAERLSLRGLYVGIFVLLVTVILIRFPYLIKAIIFILLPLALGLGSLLETGIRGDSLFFFLAFVTFTSLLIGPRAGVISIIITELIIVGTGYLILNNQLELLDKSAVAGDLADWISASVSQALISLVVMYALRMLIENVYETQQRANAMQQSQLVSEKDMEERVRERTQELSRKTDLLNATSTVTHQISGLQDLDKLLSQAVNLISKNFTCYHVGVYLLNQRGDYVTLQAASSEGGKRLLEGGYRQRVGTEGNVGYVAAERKPRISLDVSQDVIFLHSAELAETKSELSLPLIAHNKVVGVLDLQSSEVRAFRYDEVDIFQKMADQLAIAIENARLLTESQLVISQLEIISNENTRQNWKSELAVHKPSFKYSITGVHPVDKPALPRGKNVLEVPIVLRGQKIGNISLHRKATFQKWNAHEEAIANEVAAQTALALENIRLVERTRERVNREQALSMISARIRESLDLDVVLRTSAREIQKALNLHEAEIRLISQDNPDDERPVELTLS